MIEVGGRAGDVLPAGQSLMIVVELLRSQQKLLEGDLVKARQNAFTNASARPSRPMRNGVPSRAPFLRARASTSPTPGTRSSTETHDRLKS